MTLGQRILEARQAAGLSQRELAGEEITRNMLSALEHDSANPSVATLQYLSRRLGRPVSWFLGEDRPPVDGYDLLCQARESYDRGEYRQCLASLEELQAPGEVIDREVALLQALAAMALGARMLENGRMPYARELLERAACYGARSPYFTPSDRAALALLRHRAGAETALPDVDAVLLARAERALLVGSAEDALRFLDGCESRDGDGWEHLRGKCLMALGRWSDAAAHFHRIESRRDVRRELEDCYREQGDFRMAYHYARQTRQ